MFLRRSTNLKKISTIQKFKKNVKKTTSAWGCVPIVRRVFAARRLFVGVGARHSAAPNSAVLRRHVPRSLPGFARKDCLSTPRSWRRAQIPRIPRRIAGLEFRQPEPAASTTSSQSKQHVCQDSTHRRGSVVQRSADGRLCRTSVALSRSFVIAVSINFIPKIRLWLVDCCV